MNITPSRILLCFALLICLGVVMANCVVPTDPPVRRQPAPQRQPSVGGLMQMWLADQRLATAAGSPDAPTHRSLLGSLIRTRETAEGTQVRVFVEHQGERSALIAMGMQGLTSAGSIHTGWIPQGQVSGLLRLKDLRAVAFTRRLRPHLNLSAPAVFAPQARDEFHLDGRGVIIGIIDTGIDVFHPAFRHPDGRSRVLSILDYSLPSSSEEGAKPPRLFQKAEIDHALAGKSKLAHQDRSGHGSHIAGIAAGNGRVKLAGEARYMGIAPRADIVFVKAVRAGEGDFDGGDVLEGIAYIHQLARRLKKPYVINLSLGGQHGGHDGNSFLERAIDAFSGDGKQGQSIVVSAGNEGSAAMHASGWIQTGQPGELEVEIPAYDVPASSSEIRVVVELWYPYEDALKASVLTPRGEAVGPFLVTQGTQTPQKTSDGFVMVSHVIRSLPPASNHLTVVLTNGDGVNLASGVWKLRLEGKSARFDAWITNGQVPSGAASFRRYRSQEMLIGVPGAALGVLTVGSFTSRNAWYNAQGASIRNNIAVGAISGFSSPGPTRDGRPKPEIVAPGIFIAAPGSSQAGLSPSNTLSGVPYAISQGTSQAAPHVTGGVALLLQHNPLLDTPTLRRLLISSASTDSFTQGSQAYHHKWGFGKLNLSRALQSLQGFSKQAPSPSLSTIGSLVTSLPADGQSTVPIYIIPKDEKGLPLGPKQLIQVRSTHGTILPPVTSSSPGVYQILLRAPSTPAEAVVTAWIGSVRLSTTRAISFVPPVDTIRSGCACTTAPSPASASVLSLLFLFLSLAFSAKKR